MSARVAVGLVILLAAPPVLADHASPRGGGSVSTKSTGHPSHSVSSSHRSSSHNSGSHAVPRTDAERRHPRAGTGSGSRGGHYPYGYHPYYGSHSYYGYYPYSSYYYGYGYYPYWDWGWGWGWGYPSRRIRIHRDVDRGDEYGSLRILVSPDDARVFVDGRYVGEVDDYDGMFDRLRVTAGRHELALKKQGYRTHRFLIYVPEYESIKIHFHMVKGTGEDPIEDLAGDQGIESPRRVPSDDPGMNQEPEEDRPVPEREQASAPSARGDLTLSVRPDDASVYVDGQFRGTGRDLSRIEVTVGRHRIEIVRPGFKTFETDVEVGQDRAARVEVELERP